MTPAVIPFLDLSSLGLVPAELKSLYELALTNQK